MPKLMVKTELAASPEMLWKMIGRFRAIGDWHPMIETVESEGEGQGEIRKLQLAGGQGAMVERVYTVRRRRGGRHQDVAGCVPGRSRQLGQIIRSQAIVFAGRNNEQAVGRGTGGAAARPVATEGGWREKQDRVGR